MKVRKFLLPVLAMLLLCILVACGGVQPNPGAATTTLGNGTSVGSGTSDISGSTSDTNPGGTGAENLTIDASYFIIYRKGGTDIDTSALATELQTAIKAVIGSELTMDYPILTDKKLHDKEIIVGDVVNYSEGAREGVTKKMSDYSGSNWEIKVAGQRVIINGGSVAAIEAAVDYFCTTYVKGTSIIVPATLTKTGKIAATNVVMGTANSAKLLATNATVGANGVTMQNVGSALSFKVSAGSGSIVATFNNSAAATFMMYTDRDPQGKEISVASGNNVQVTLLEGQDGKDKEVMLVKKSGTAATILTTLTGDQCALGAKPTVVSAATETLFTNYNSDPTGTVTTGWSDPNKTNLGKYLKVLGRGYQNEYGVSCDFSAAGFEFTVYNAVETEVKARFVTSRPARKSGVYGDGDTYFTVFVDGVRQTGRVYVANSNYGSSNKDANVEVVLTAALAPGAHHIRIVRQGQIRYSLCALKGITVTGELGAKPANREKFIEVIGDSITAGCFLVLTEADKVDGEWPSDKSTSKWCDTTQTYAFLTAENLNADCAIFAWSGKGLTVKENVRVQRSLNNDNDATDTGETDQDEEMLIQDLYLYRTYIRKLLIRPDNTQNPYFHFAETRNIRKPDAIIVNLGTNDVYGFRDGVLTTAEDMAAEVNKFITTLRTYNGADVPIVWVYGCMGTTNTERNYIEEVNAGLKLALEGKESQNIFLVKLTTDRSGVSAHPTIAGNKTMAEELTAFFKANVPGFKTN